MDSNEVLRVVQMKGPILPIKIKAEIGGDTITIGAILSELSHSKKLKISNTKIGGSPVYYVDSQISKLQDLYKYLNDKQQRAFDLLKKNTVLKDRDQTPVIRLALRHIKDFARPLEVKTKEGTEIYWKWYLADNQDAEVIIRKDLNLAPKKAVKKGIPKPVAQKPKIEPKQTTLPGESGVKITSEFLTKVRSFFSRRGIEVIEEDIVRKNSEADFIIDVPGQLGKQKYYCKAKNKKKSNDGDLSSAYIKGQTKKLPVIYLITGEITKKAQEMLEDDFKGMMVKKI